MTEKNYTIEDIKRVLPHAYPFLLIDRITESVEGKYIKGYKNISFNEPYFQGHFKQQSIYPGVLIVESLGQLGAFNLLNVKENEGKLVFLVGLDKMRFRGMVTPGDRIDLKVEIIEQRGDIGKAHAEASVNESLIVSGELTFCIR